MTETIDTTKWERLKAALAEMGGVVVAFSGGVDSSLLAKAAHDALGDRALAVTGVSETVKASELSAARAVAQQIGIGHFTVETGEMANPEFIANAPNRCYHCKTELFTVLKRLASKRGLNQVVEGSNVDDTSDFRPGLTASEKQNVRRPFIEVGLTKSEIRDIARRLGLPNWDKPASPCLSSRFPYGQEISSQALKMVAQGEELLQQLGIKEFRLRHHREIARIEVRAADFETVLAHADAIVAGMKRLGYHYITLDLEGFRSGSLNEPLQPSGR